MGEVFAGRYELLDLIGEGGMGTIWIAHDRRTDTHVAAKVLRQSESASLLRFVREQSVRIHHPHVLTPLGWAGEDDRVLFTMPIVRGGSVATLIGDHGPLPPLLVAEILRQLLAGLGAVHDAGLVHRDVKPANVLLDATGTGRPRAVLSDFGIALDLSAPRWTETGFVSGTPGYLAPEAETRGALSPSTDLYAAGQVALTMLTSQRPSDRIGLLRPSTCPEVLWEVLTDLTAADPGARPATAGDARRAMEIPELAWRPEGIGDVEIFDQIAAPAPAAVDDASGEEDKEVAPTVLRPVRALADTSAPARPHPPASGLVVGGLLLVAVLGLLLLWSPWDSGGPGPTRTPTGRSSAPTATAPGTPTTPAATPPTTSPSASQTAAPTTAQGSVSVGTVVVAVGQACEFVDVGQSETTVDGVPVMCRLQPGGGYAWVAR